MTARTLTELDFCLLEKLEIDEWGLKRSVPFSPSHQIGHTLMRGGREGNYNHSV